MRRGSGSLEQKLRQGTKTGLSAFVESIQETEMGCPERLCSLHLCRFSRPDVAKATSCSDLRAVTAVSRRLD